MVLAFALAGCSADDLQPSLDDRPVSGPELPSGAREATVVRVVDGDTVELGGGLGKSRLIGIDTPEVYGGVECYGREASAYAKRQLDGRRVRYTVGRDERDRYGRLLVYLWLEDGRSFNALLVSRGYAQPLTIPPNDDYASAFVRLSRRARERAVGLWASRACAGAAGLNRGTRYLSAKSEKVWASAP
ncbi:MAG: thermonuclease family protein [Thermoleophilaceae bacterium]